MKCCVASLYLYSFVRAGVRCGAALCGRPDAGRPDAGQPDAGRPDAEKHFAGGLMQTAGGGVDF